MSAKTMPQPSVWPRTIAGIIIFSLLAVIVFLMAPVVIQTFMPESSRPPDESATTTDKQPNPKTGTIPSGEPGSNSTPRGSSNKPRVNSPKTVPTAVDQKSKLRVATPAAVVHTPASNQLNNYSSAPKTAPANTKNSIPSFMPGISIGAPESSDSIIRPTAKH